MGHAPMIAPWAGGSYQAAARMAMALVEKSPPHGHAIPTYCKCCGRRIKDAGRAFVYRTCTREECCEEYEKENGERPE